MKLPVQVCLLAFCAIRSAADAASPSWDNCATDEECVLLFRNGSRCVDNVCQNSFYYGGCLKSMIPGWDKIRVCSSDDPLEAETLGYCRPSPMGYHEVRLPAKNWHTATFLAWILQVLLGEILDVPVSIETGVAGNTMNLYDMEPGFEYWNNLVSNDYEELKTAYRVKDCRLADKSPESYQSCVHFMPEIWYYGDPQNVGEGIEPVRELGAMAEDQWFIPRFAVDADPTLATWIGLSGPENRHKIAETFQRPTRWQHYCDEVSLTRCAEPDQVAQRAPMDDAESKSFFVADLYTGFFRVTDAGNCTKFPTNCTGHFINFDCGWQSMAVQQSYHLDIPMAFEGPELNGGYPYEETIQIMDASTATKSPIVAFWYTPEPGVESRVGTEFEFIRVLFPTPTKECVDNLADFQYACDPNATLEQKVGSPLGACDTYPLALSKAFSLALKEIAEDRNVISEFHSPAYDVVNSFKIDTLQFGVLFKYWEERGDDKFNFGSRDAACRWAAENIDTLRSFIPKSHPRTIRRVDTFDQPLFRAASVIGTITVAFVLIAMLLACLKRKTKAIYYTQIEYLNLILLGLFFTAVGAIMYSIDPQDNWNCAVRPFFTNLGYVLQLVPLCLRIIAINNLAISGKHMQRVRLPLSKLFACVGVASSLLLGFLIVWICVDTPKHEYSYEMTDSVSLNGETFIDTTLYCGSDNDFWWYVDIAWMAVLLLPACMISFMARRVKEDLNDTKSLSNVLFVYLLFLLMTAVAYAVLWDQSKSSLMACRSLILSLNTIAAFVIYVLPKFLAGGEHLDAEPLPDVFVHTTVALIKLDGFTAWTSVREPVQVFQFLERLYEQFDHQAARHSIFKVETVGECYVCATGVPKPQHDHAVRMAKFSSTLMHKMPKYLQNMEVTFGPDTADLSLRIGLHSGPVTGGFLRGKGSRFQLFGTTTNTANLILENGSSGRIHVSEETARLLIKAGKPRWIAEREDNIYNAEVGKLSTWWLVKNNSIDDEASSMHLLLDDGDISESQAIEELGSEQRWIEWNVGVFIELLKQVVAKNSALIQQNKSVVAPVLKTAAMPLEEVQEVIYLPEFDKKAARRQRDHEDIEIPEKVVQELKEFVAEVAARYNNDNPFHNFAHASYVVMAITKYMNRVVAGQELGLGDSEERFRSSVQATLHDHTYGITSDPLTLFACAFSALIHDVNHPGVPNAQLIKENEDAAAKYQGRSVAEQRSLDISWDLLMEDRFNDLRSVLCHNNLEELQRFRQLCVNSILATDLGDKQLKELRNARWEKAFSCADTTTNSSMAFTVNSNSNSVSELDSSVKYTRKEAINRKATIVIEHLIQASDVAHMSQHWNIYRKWNERLFREVYKAWREGREDSNPAETWYKGEIGFFDFYIIPLSKKLRDCGVFGPTSDENLNYARNNRNMWVKEGEAIVKGMLERVEQEYNERLADPEQPPQAVVFEAGDEMIPPMCSV